MKKLTPFLLAALAACAAAIAADGWRSDIGVANPTGGVATAYCRVGEVVRLDYSLDKAGTLQLVRALGGTALSTTNLATSAGSGTLSNVGIIGGGDYFRLSAATNATAKIYVITK